MKIYNTLSKTKEEFKPIEDTKIKMYVCGPTVYDYSHLGHAKGYVSMDVIRRYLEWRGYAVTYVQNFTDVGHLTDDADEGEDKIEKRAKETKVDPMELVDQYINAYYEDFRALQVKDATIAPRPSQHIEEIIEFVKVLIQKKYAYEVNGSVYFDVAKFKDYGKLSGRKLEEMEAGARVEIREEKQNPADFALWIKAEPEHILKWESPWSLGYPGWHIECSVMSYKYLGDTFDIHGGGIDNIFPHNEDEKAQSEAYTGKPMANYWVLYNLVNIGGEKMSKSKGNFTTVRELLQKHDPEVIRYAILKSHYRSTIDFNEKMFEESQNSIEGLHDFMARLQLVDSDKPNNLDVSGITLKTREDFIQSMDDDFNTPLALSKIFGLIKEVNKIFTQLNTTQSESILAFLYDLDEVLQLRLDKIRPSSKDLPEFLDELILEREDARRRKDWETADRIRDELLRHGIELEDTSKGVRWKKIKG
ncbi:TPA: cysteine--tRNA ligase [candidate division CPR2 bacterium]|uniref:Cysteine--tRNA ligase n=1 Tax=candidate division CPR2 bacterium GW2011_GWC1_41_48 TaxID=1618344 RepID=A0A0G0WA60_UNCC2|nr:MAG: Cysteine-tRNA ligase [candidate division CPR2 bacterium GW2011_GWC2_39_35]KKR28856.1 MAG: Cysteine-tRNA ligase [candidate division CPR2 bacterium GW2011_GWD2_39_7]KKR29388.1 MAG: Cysteine-tRNA ligase [candidate division CPR2 bacterium GW2011_GWD1_39_7]KKS09899.1 MAG: cysteinyl-tRNA synthetase, cysteinyl-tRNA synthetase [candidate division CPR2 bacterium GW2011_GWC1_41_48]OGB62277.1 MAG: cysteine--tRNA ligase [candidate division CPR2 bacterium GWD1_39_7]OGB73202.1 MAG: cysteine--tRNA li